MQRVPEETALWGCKGREGKGRDPCVQQVEGSITEEASGQHPERDRSPLCWREMVRRPNERDHKQGSKSRHESFPAEPLRKSFWSEHRAHKGNRGQEFGERGVVVFSAAETNCHELVGEDNKYIILQFWRKEVQNVLHWAQIKVSAGLYSFRRL